MGTWRPKTSIVVFLCSALAPAFAGQTLTFSVIYTFMGGADGGTPLGNLILNNNILYGTASGAGAHHAGTVYQVNTVIKVLSVLHAFTGGPGDGANPLGGLLRDANGDIYGTTYGGGAHLFGTVFEFPAVGYYRVIHNFSGPTAQGSGPAGTLVMDGANNIYGTTYAGGDTTGFGTVFEILSTGEYKTGQSFSPDGALPRAGLFIQGGNLYGTTSGGGARQYGGTVFQVAVSTPLYTFSGGADGSQPLAGLTGDGANTLYGVTSAGGDGSFGNGHGVIFSIDTFTGNETVLHTFTGPDGATPAGTLVRDASGNLYGTTMMGGAFNHGTVFEFTAGGTLQTLYSFTGGADGGHPYAGLLLDASGNLWGVASQGGSAPAPAGWGTVFKIEPEP